MPYDKGKPPAGIKSLPSGAKSIWIETFNSVHGETGDETKARQAAWANVKERYKKEGDRWVPKKGKTERSGVVFRARGGWSEGAHPRDSKGKFAPKGGGRAGKKGGSEGGLEGLVKGLTDLGWSAFKSSGTVIGEAGDLSLMLEPNAKGGGMTSIFDAGRDVEVQLEGIKQMSPSSAKRRLKSEYPDEYRSEAMPSQALVQMSLVVTKASQHEDGGLRWAVTASDTGEDSYKQRTSLGLFQDWIQRAETGQTEDFLPAPRMPFLGVAHYPSLSGDLGVAGDTEKMYVDGQQFKASGFFREATPVGKASYEAIRSELDLVKKGEQPDQPVRISAAWWDVQHRHGDYVFTRKSITEQCPVCMSGSTEGVEYLKGQLDHLALTRVPVHPRAGISLVEMSSTRTTRKSDAASILGDELAEELDAAYRVERVKRSEVEEPDVVMSEGEDEGVVDVGPISLADAWALVQRSEQEGVSEWAVLATVMRAISDLEDGDVPSAVAGLSGELTSGTMVVRAEGDEEPLDGAIDLSTALEGAADAGLTGWDMLTGLVGNIADLPEEEVPTIYRALVSDLEDQLDELLGVVMDDFLDEPIITRSGGDTMGHDVTQKAEDVLQLPAGIEGFPEAVAKVLQSRASREEKLEKLQNVLNQAAAEVQKSVDHPDDVGEAVAAAIERSLAPISQQLAQLLGQQGQPTMPVMRAATPVDPGQPVRRSVQPGDVVINDPAQATQQLPVSPVTGQQSALTALVRRSVGLVQ